MSLGNIRQLSALLAMPAALRPVLLGRIAYCKPRSTSHRLFSVSTNFYKVLKYPDVAAFAIPEFRTSSITEIAPADLLQTSSLLSAPDKPLEEELTKLFTKNPASFAYAESDFYKLKKNTRLPEVCILGRSNVGKSSFVNALANRSSYGLSYVSSKAGKTRSINTYGFGPAPTMKELEGKAAEHKDEELPKHTFLLVDMPGYGHASQKEWGKNIALYLSKRAFVKGAMVLIDAEVGPKDSDLHLLEFLSEAQLKTAVVLTKADKVKKGLEGLRETCTKVWDAIHAIDVRITEGNWVWDRDIYVTALGARDTAVRRSTLTTARLTIARLAGLVQDQRPHIERSQRWSGKMISFDDLPLAPAKTGTSRANDASGASLEQASTGSLPRNTGGLSKNSTAFASLDRASKLQNSTRPGLGTGLGSESWSQGSARWARAFHSTAAQHREKNQQQRQQQQPSKPTKHELKDILHDFVNSLKADSKRDEVRRLQQEREKNQVFSFGRSPEESELRQSRKFQRKHPQQAFRAQEVISQRIQTVKQRPNEASSANSAEPSGWDWPSSPTPKGKQKGNSEVISKDAFEKAFSQSVDLFDAKASNKASNKTAMKQTATKKGSKKSKKDDWAAEAHEDPFTAQFAAKMASKNNVSNNGRASF
jgi:ribosome biogenesis GTP-binding protein YsxC/EngB